jgi:uncharacterized membrane protein YfcA
MSRSKSSRRQPAGRGRGQTTRSRPGGQSIRTLSTSLLVGVVAIVAVLMVMSFAGFAAKPDPAIKAGPMYVTLALTTGAALLMLFVAVNATYWPVISRVQARNVHLVMWTMGIVGIITGVLTVGRPVSSFVQRLVIASIALVFIVLQDARLAKARAAAAAGGGQGQGAAAKPQGPGRQAKPNVQARRPASRQRRGGRKR